MRDRSVHYAWPYAMQCCNAAIIDALLVSIAQTARSLGCLVGPAGAFAPSRGFMSRFLSGLTLVALLSMGLPTQAQLRASSGDLRYCAALSQLYMRYVGNPETEPRGLRRNDAAADAALAQCREGNAVAAIPVLERKLVDNKITLPVRE